MGATIRLSRQVFLSNISKVKDDDRFSLENSIAITKWEYIRRYLDCLKIDWMIFFCRNFEKTFLEFSSLFPKITIFDCQDASWLFDHLIMMLSSKSKNN